MDRDGERKVWRIDTLDARAGLAFASQRTESLLHADDQSMDRGGVFIGPPDFQPQPVASRALALGAGRGRFQTGLFVAEVEVDFPDLDAVKEFVRRAYIRGGGGDGADGGGGGGGPPPPREDGEPPPLPPEPEDGVELRDVMAAATKEFDRHIAKTTTGSSTPVLWPLSDMRIEQGGAPTDVLKGAPAMLLTAVRDLLFAMAVRLPDPGDRQSVRGWQNAARRLAKVIGSLHLWPAVLADPWLQGKLTRWISGRLRLRHMDDARLIPAILHWGIPTRERDLDHLWRELDYRYDRGWPWSGWGTADPMQDLSAIPLPVLCGIHLQLDLAEQPSLANGLAAWIGSPVPDGNLIELSLFCAAYIVAAAESDLLWDHGRLWLGGWSYGDDEEQIELLVAQAWAWLAAQLPNRAFSREVEDSIRQTTALRYPAR